MTDVLDALSYAAPSPFADVIFLDLEALIADGFEEDAHPRDEHGHFIDTSKEDKPLEAHSRNELIDRLRAAGYTGPTSYTKDKLQEIVRQHEATSPPTAAPEPATPTAESSSSGDGIPGAQLREFVEPLSLLGTTYGDAAGKVFAVATAKGGQVRLFIDEDVTKGGQLTTEEKQVMLSTVADLHDRYGEGKEAPSVTIVSRATADSFTNGMGMTTKAYVTNNISGINIVGQNIRQAEKSKTWFMPSSRTLDPIRATTMHEYGHVHDMFIRSYRPADERGPTRDAMFRQVVGAGTKSIVKETSTGLPNAGGISKYGQTNAYEAYAEAFQEYVGTGGTSDLPAVQAYAEAYGWNK